MLAVLFAFLILPDIDEPAYADNHDEPPRIHEIDYIEVNRCVRGQQVLEQVVFWRVQYDRHDRTYTTIDCGWRHWNKVALIETEEGWAAISDCDNAVWIAPRIYWSVTDFDPELVYRENQRW